MENAGIFDRFVTFIASKHYCYICIFVAFITTKKCMGGAKIIDIIFHEKKTGATEERKKPADWLDMILVF